MEPQLLSEPQLTGGPIHLSPIYSAAIYGKLGMCLVLVPGQVLGTHREQRACLQS